MRVDASEKANYPITMMCQLLDVPRSTYYDWTHRAGELTATAARRAVLGVLVCEVFDEFLETYGCRRITLVLNERGVPCCIHGGRDDARAGPGPRCSHVRAR